MRSIFFVEQENEVNVDIQDSIGCEKLTQTHPTNDVRFNELLPARSVPSSIPEVYTQFTFTIDLVSAGLPNFNVILCNVNDFGIGWFGG